MIPSRVFFSAWLATVGFAAAALTDNFDTYPSGGSGWSANWSNSTTTSLATPTVASASPLNGGGNYLSVTTTVANSTTGIQRSIGAMAASPYTLTFDWRYDSNDANFNNYEDRIHFGASTQTGFGTNDSFTWLIGIIGNNNPGTDGTLGTGDDTIYAAHKVWYFYDNTSTSANGAFTSANMQFSTMTLTTGTTYSFTVSVNPATQKYDASVTDGVTTFSRTNMDFRNQRTVDPDATNGASNLIFGGANTGSGHTLNWSMDNLVIVPEPSSLILAGLSGLLCFKRRRIAG